MLYGNDLIVMKILVVLKIRLNFLMQNIISDFILLIY